MIRKIISLSLVLLLIVLIVFSLVFHRKYNRPPDSPSEQIIFSVEQGKSVRAVADDLRSRGIILETWPLLLGYRLFFRKETLKAGEYAFDCPVSPREILNTITSGRIILYPLTVPEGLTRRETAAHLNEHMHIEESDFLEASEKAALITDADPDADTLEGYLFPETYHYPKNTSAEQVVSAMVRQFRQVYSEAWRKRTSDLGMTLREVVILASLIEKETSVPEERSLVSAVFHNRLRLGMKLDCDPTIIYALKEEGQFKGNLRKKHLSMDSPYNTYLYRGLPPGPIANPGQGSLEAALYPADVDYLYFVSKNDGSHHFSSSFREHQNAVNRFQRKRR